MQATCRCSRPAAILNRDKQPQAVATRRWTLLKLGASTIPVLTALAPMPSATAADSNSGSALKDKGTISGIAIVPVDKSVKEAIKQRDENMDFKCKGGMMDCDGDRREYAKKQYESWLERDGRKQ